MTEKAERVKIVNQECDHGRWFSCSVYLEPTDNGGWMAKCSDGACTTNSGESVWRAGGRSNPFTYEQLRDIAKAHCLKKHSH